MEVKRFKAFHPFHLVELILIKLWFGLLLDGDGDGDGDGDASLRDSEKRGANVAARPLAPHVCTKGQIPNIMLPPLFTSLAFKCTQINFPIYIP